MIWCAEMALYQGSVGHGGQAVVKQYLEFIEHCIFPVNQTLLFKKNLFTGFIKDALYLLLGCRLHYRIKRKKKCRQLNKFFCSGNSSVKQDASILLRQCDRILPPISFFWRVMNVGHWLFWNFPSLLNILPCSLPSSLQWWLYWKGSMHVLVKRVIMRGRDWIGSMNGLEMNNHWVS